jgi:hypothetical protein
MSNEISTSKFDGCRGLFVKRRDNAPDFVKAELGIRVEEFKAYLDANVKSGGFVNIDILLSKGNVLYAKLNDFEKKEDSQASSDMPAPVESIQDLPF